MHEPGGNEEEDEEDASPCGRLVWGSELVNEVVAGDPRLGFCFGFLLRVWIPSFRMASGRFTWIKEGEENLNLFKFNLNFNSVWLLIVKDNMKDEDAN